MSEWPSGRIWVHAYGDVWALEFVGACMECCRVGVQVRGYAKRGWVGGDFGRRGRDSIILHRAGGIFEVEYGRVRAHDSASVDSIATS